MVKFWFWNGIDVDYFVFYSSFLTYMALEQHMMIQRELSLRWSFLRYYRYYLRFFHCYWRLCMMWLDEFYSLYCVLLFSFSMLKLHYMMLVVYNSLSLMNEEFCMLWLILVISVVEKMGESSAWGKEGLMSFIVYIAFCFSVFLC